MTRNKQHQEQAIDALSIASEFLMCAIRAHLKGDEVESRRFVEYALSKTAEAGNMQLRVKRKKRKLILS